MPESKFFHLRKAMSSHPHPLSLAAAALAAVLAAGCAQTNSATSPPDILGSSFVWSSAGAEIAPYITFDEKNGLHGQAGCNGFFGKWTRSDHEFMFSELGATLRMCDAESMRIEDEFLDALRRTRNLRAAGDGIELLDDAGSVLLKLDRRL